MPPTEPCTFLRVLPSMIRAPLLSLEQPPSVAGSSLSEKRSSQCCFVCTRDPRLRASPYALLPTQLPASPHAHRIMSPHATIPVPPPPPLPCACIARNTMPCLSTRLLVLHSDPVSSLPCFGRPTPSHSVSAVLIATPDEEKISSQDGT